MLKITKNKMSIMFLTGIAMITGVVGGTAFVAQAKVVDTPSAPLVSVTSNAVKDSVDTTESTQGGKVDTDNVQEGPGSIVDQQNEKDGEGVEAVDKGGAETSSQTNEVDNGAHENSEPTSLLDVNEK